ncbi:MAG: NAD-binding oxidoreductase, partial [Paracoccaceae bacterium]|nr:NAD-binding oxidoreductase [Paracoccaceae bacterium]
MRIFSTKDRPVHLGPFPLERLLRSTVAPDLAALPVPDPLLFDDPDPLSLTHAMARYMAMFDTVRDGPVTHGAADIPADPVERSRHLKAAGYYYDATMVGICALTPAHLLAQPHRNPMIDALRTELESGQPKSHAAGIDAIYADVLDAARLTPGPIPHHSHAIVFLVEYTRDPEPGELGTDWFHGTQAQRAALLTNNTAVVISSYLRMLGHQARAHSASTSDIDLARLAVSAGLASVTPDGAEAPFV